MKTKLNRNRVAPVLPEVMDIEQARAYLGISYGVMRRIVDSGGLAYRKSGKRYLITKKSIDSWLNYRPQEK